MKWLAIFFLLGSAALQSFQIMWLREDVNALQDRGCTTLVMERQ